MIFSTLSAVIFWKSKLLSISTWFFISTILGCVEGSYTTLCPILSATVEKKELKFSETSFASFMILLFSQRKIFCSTELHFFRTERFNSCPKITSFGTSRAAFQKIIFHGFRFQFSNQISLLSKFLPCFSIALLGILGIQHMFTVYTCIPSKLTVHTGKWIFSRSSCLDRSMFV